jgi:hypothetical protein
MALLLCPALAQAQDSPSDSATISAESIQNLRAEIETTQKSLGALNKSMRQISNSSVLPVGEDVDRTKIVNVLVLVLVLSLVFESAMSVIFDWRVFIRHFEGRGVKTPFIIGVAFLIFLNYDLDIVTQLLAAFPNVNADTGGVTLSGQLLTALLIAGGSGGVFRIFSRLGIRSPEERDRKAQEERAPQTDAPNEKSSGGST